MSRMPTPHSHNRPLPAPFAGTEPCGLVRESPVAQFELGPYKNFVYLAIDWSLKGALVIDPARELEPLLSALQNTGLSLTGIVLTHSHHDHISGVPGLLTLHPELPLHVHPLDSHRLPAEVQAKARPATEGSLIPLAPGSELALHVLHAPGHSAGELCLKLEASEETYLFTGDTLFIRDCGRTDLPTGDDAQMYETLQRLKQLPGDIIILPGHHYTRECASRLRTELETSPPLMAASIEELARL